MMKRNNEIDDLTFYSMLSVLQGGMWLLNDIENYLEVFNISHGRFSIMLSVLEAGKKPVRPSELAVKLGKSKPTITKMINKLINDDLVNKTGSDDDKRSSILHLTDKGETLLLSIIPGYNERILKMSASLSDSDKIELMEIISKIDFFNPLRKIEVKI